LNDLNNILLEGNITRDPDSRTTPSGTLICTFPVASNRYYRSSEGKEKETSFFDIETWGKLSENCMTLAHKGRGCRVAGRLKQEKWDGPDGKTRSKIIIVAERIEYKPECHKEEDV